MTVMAREPARTQSAPDLAARSHLSAATVAKLLRQLAGGGLVESVRGARGGYRLARSPGDITVADVVAALEGPIALTECAGAKSCCSIESHCGIRGNWRLINAALETALRSVTFAQMAAPSVVTMSPATHVASVPSLPRSL